MFKKIIDIIVIFISKLMVKHTDVMITSVLDFEKLVKKSKKLIVIFWTPKCIWCQKVLFKYPLFLYNAKKTKNILKFCDIKSHKSFKNIWIKSTPTLRAYKNWKLKEIIENDNEILTYLTKLWK